MTMRTCNVCGWVMFGVTRGYAERAVADFNAYFTTLTQAQRDDYYGGKGASIAAYERCFRCGGPYTNFREAKAGDCPNGCTMQPIMIIEDAP